LPLKTQKSPCDEDSLLVKLLIFLIGLDPSSFWSSPGTVQITGSGSRSSKTLEMFRARKAITKSRPLRLRSLLSSSHIPHEPGVPFICGGFRNAAGSLVWNSNTVLRQPPSLFECDAFYVISDEFYILWGAFFYYTRCFCHHMRYFCIHM